MSFSELGIKGRNVTKDGQRFFDLKKVRISDILNIPVTVVDFEPNIKTRNGDGRYAVSIRLDGEDLKFITNSFTLKSMLDQARELNALPIDTRLRRRDIGDGLTDYYFE